MQWSYRFVSGVLVLASIIGMAFALYLEHVTYTHLRAHETLRYLGCRLLLEKKKKQRNTRFLTYD